MGLRTKRLLESWASLKKTNIPSRLATPFAAEVEKLELPSTSGLRLSTKYPMRKGIAII